MLWKGGQISDRFPVSVAIEGLGACLRLFRTSPLKPFLESSVGIFPAAGDLDGEGVVDYHILADGGFDDVDAKAA
ncbi:unnamed protein product [Heligmosomoides polygyrus]|uniref:VCBS repeat-containing protein n=1 Tax=Heligmosomoides polygyrus TaxID=6339 RepID=A0A183GKV7_HELPZ|nr:unnamed protein product [Heligmosomoides polygyrus]